MSNRATAAERTGDRIADAALEVYAQLPYEQIRLDDVAARAGVTVQTVIRRFGSKPGLITAMAERELGRIAEARVRQRGATPAEVLHELVGHYERYGALILKVYAEAGQVEGLPELAARGRAYHVGWCRDAFAETLAGVADDDVRRRRVAQLTAICDATTWRILRADGGLDPEQTETALAELVRSLLAGT